MLSGRSEGLGALPVGAWVSTPNLFISLGDGQTLKALSMSINTLDGTRYSFVGTYSTSGGEQVDVTLKFSGTAVCSTDEAKLIITIDTNSCVQYGSIRVPPVCQFAPALYSGAFSYGVSSNGPTLLINQWSGSLYPILFLCPANNCSASLACNISSIIEFTNNIYGGQLNATNSFVQLFANTSAVFYGDEITLTQNNNVTIQQSNAANQTTINVSGDNNNVTLVANDSTYYNVITNAPASCRNFAYLTGARSDNTSISTIAYTRIVFTLSSLLAPANDWSLPTASTLQFDGNNGDYGYIVTLCLQLAELYNPSAVGQRVLVGLFNVTAGGGNPTLLGTPTSSAVFYNHTDPEFVTGSCTSYPISSLGAGTQFGVFAALDRTDLSAGAALLSASSFTLSAMPLACRGVTNNFNISAQFNGTQLQAGCAINLTNPDSKTVLINNLGLKSIRANSDAKIQNCGEARLVDTTTTAWSTSGSDLSVDVLLKFFAMGAGLSVSRSGANVTYTYLELLFKALGQFLSVSQSGRNVTYAYTGLDTIRGGSDGVWLVGNVTIRVSPRLTVQVVGQDIIIGMNETTNSNDTSCIHCDGNGTLSVDKVCSKEQCTVNPDSPMTNSPSPIQHFPCLFCNSGHDGDGSSGPAGAVPPPPLVPPIVPFFPPIIAAIPGVPGSGSVPTGVVLPATPVPIYTNCSANATTDFGMKFPRVNFSESVPCCNNNSWRMVVFDVSTNTDIIYVCMRTLNDSFFAWTPIPTSWNATTYYVSTSQLFSNNATIAGDNSSQLIWNGPAFMQLLYVNSFLSIPAVNGLPADRPPGEPANNKTYVFFDLSRGEFLIYRGGGFDSYFYVQPTFGQVAGQVRITCDTSETGLQCQFGLYDDVRVQNSVCVGCGNETPIHTNKGDFTARNVYVNETLHMCYPSAYIEATDYRGCSGGPASFSQGATTNNFTAVNSTSTNSYITDSLHMCFPGDYIEATEYRGCSGGAANFPQGGTTSTGSWTAGSTVVTNALTTSQTVCSGAFVGGCFSADTRANLPNGGILGTNTILKDFNSSVQFYKADGFLTSIPMIVVDNVGLNCNGLSPTLISMFYIRNGATVTMLLPDLVISASASTICYSAFIDMSSFPRELQPTGGWQHVGNTYDTITPPLPFPALPPPFGVHWWSIYAGASPSGGQNGKPGIYINRNGDALPQFASYTMPQIVFTYITKETPFPF